VIGTEDTNMEPVVVILSQRLRDGKWWEDYALPNAPVKLDEWGQNLLSMQSVGTHRVMLSDGSIHSLNIRQRTVFELDSLLEPR
jgi:hypothetical protein